MTTWQLSGFADEISPDPAEQCAVLAELGMSRLEFRSAWSTNVSELSAAQLDRAARVLDDHGITVSCIGSPVGKTPLATDGGEHRSRFRRCLEAAAVLRAPAVRVFSFAVEQPGRPADRDAVVERLAALAAEASGAGVTLLHENETGMWGDTPQRCRELARAVDSPAFRLTWDPANFVAAGVRPREEAYDVVRPWLTYVQVKDKVAATGAVVPAGEGDGEIPETVAALAGDGFEGVFSLEPHLGRSVGGSPFSGPELFRRAHAAFTRIVSDRGVELV